MVASVKKENASVKASKDKKEAIAGIVMRARS